MKLVYPVYKGLRLSLIDRLKYKKAKGENLVTLALELQAPAELSGHGGMVCWQRTELRDFVF